MTATTTTTTTTTTTGATMASIRASKELAKFFALDGASAISATKNKGAAMASAIATSALALTGAAIVRAHSGNDNGALMRMDAAAQALTGAAKTRASAALALVMADKPRAMSGRTLADFIAYANDIHSRLSEALTPVQKEAKPRATPTDWKARAERAESAHAALLAYAESLRAMLGAKAPALPVGATWPTVTEEAPALM